MILLLGASGYVGNTFQNYLISRGIEFKTVSLSAAKGRKYEILEDAIQSVGPDFLVNCAGYTGKPNVDASEKNKHLCLEANTWLVGVIGELCQKYNLPWGHVSSGCIFTGRRADGLGFTEEDAPNFSFRHNNCSFYSGTKALSEEILADYPNHYLWRLRIPYNEVASPRNYLAKIANYDSLIDVENSISQLDEFVRACWLSWEKRIPFGTYNITNPGTVTTREVAEMIDKAGLPHKDWSYFKDEAEFLEQAALTPRANCVMDSSKIMNCGIPLTDVHESLDWCLKNWKQS
jgi:dTDP-4-dehydrorhamnose reductase